MSAARAPDLGPQARIELLLEQARLVAPSLPDWAVSLLPAWIDESVRELDASAFVAWVRASDEYSWALHEVAGKGCAKPGELAALLLAEIVVEIADERAWESGRA